MVYVSFSSLDFASFAFFNIGFSVVITALIYNVAACLPQLLATFRGSAGNKLRCLSAARFRRNNSQNK